eukprot:1395136-Amorphochlora_amoeboformis.AAC.1
MTGEKYAENVSYLCFTLNPKSALPYPNRLLGALQALGSESVHKALSSENWTDDAKSRRKICEAVSALMILGGETEPIRE